MITAVAVEEGVASFAVAFVAILCGPAEKVVVVVVVVVVVRI